MEEAKQAVAQGESHTSTTFPAHIQPQRSGSRRVGLLVTVLLLSSIAGMLAWQHLDTRPAEVQPAVAAPPAPTDLAIINENQRQQITVVPVGAQPAAVERETTGKVSFNEDRLTPVVAPYAGRVLEILANKGAVVRSGQPLLVLESPELVATHNDLAAARSDVAKAKIGLDAARIAAERARGLHAQGAIATKDLQQAETELARAHDEQRRAQVAHTAVEHRLALFGKSPEEIARLDGQVDRRVIIRAPIAGTIVERKVGLGQYLRSDTSDPLFLIADLSTVWVLADVYESDLGDLHLDTPVEVSVAAYPQRTIQARIAAINPTVDPSTRTVRVRCLVSNTEGLLRPDMFAKIKIRSVMPQRVAMVPVSAVLSQGSVAFVFVEEAPGHFRRRQVQVGHEAQGYLVAQSGVQPGELVVTRGVLLLNQLLKPEG